MIITIDGLCGQGKSTVGKMLAIKAGFEFFSTGLTVRYAAYELMKSQEVHPSPDDIVSKMNMGLVVNTDPAMLKSTDLIPFLKMVTDSKYCVEHLYHLIQDYCVGRDIILDGRDTFAYFPNAELKYYFKSRIEDRVSLRMRVLGLDEKTCYDYFKKRDSIERDFTIPFNRLIVINPFDCTMEELINRMYEDVLRIKK